MRQKKKNPPQNTIEFVLYWPSTAVDGLPLSVVCISNAIGKKLVFPLQVHVSWAQIIDYEKELISIFPLRFGTPSGLDLCIPQVCCQSVNSYVHQCCCVQKKLFPWLYPSSLEFIVFLPPLSLLLHRTLSPGGRGLINTSH